LLSPPAGLSYRLLVNILSFLPREEWGNLVGFFVALVLISVALNFIFLLPRKFIQKVWGKGVLFRLVGGTLSIFGAAIGIVVFTLVVRGYPIFGWLERAVTDSSVLT